MFRFKFDRHYSLKNYFFCDLGFEISIGPAGADWGKLDSSKI